MGEYKERLSTGGELIVNENSWSISYYFPGPDRRYNGDWFTIRSNEIDEYIDAWQSNFEKYLDLKEVLSLDGTYETIGKKHMKISVGGYRDGVCIDRWHMNVRDKSRIDAIINDYRKAKDKAIKVQKLLRDL